MQVFFSVGDILKELLESFTQNIIGCETHKIDMTHLHNVSHSLDAKHKGPTTASVHFYHSITDVHLYVTYGCSVLSKLLPSTVIHKLMFSLEHLR